MKSKNNGKILPLFVIMNTMMRRYIALCIVLLSLLTANAQYDVHFTHFREVENFYNPAAMNRDDRLNVTGSFSMQMAGYTHAPVSMYIGANSVLPMDRHRHSAGAGLFNETIGLFSSKRLTIDYAYKIGMGKGWMNIGILGGVMSQEFNGGKVKAETPADPAFPQAKEKGTVADLGAGVLYVRGDLYLGASAQHINSPHVEFGKADGQQTTMDISPMFYMTGGYNIHTNNPLFEVQPCFMLSSDVDSFRADLSARASYQYDSTRLYAGLTWSPDISFTILIGGSYGNLTAGYAYEVFTCGVGYLNGSHDLMVNWQKEVDFFKKGKNSHKSVRYL